MVPCVFSKVCKADAIFPGRREFLLSELEGIPGRLVGFAWADAGTSSEVHENRPTTEQIVAGHTVVATIF